MKELTYELLADMIKQAWRDGLKPHIRSLDAREAGKATVLTPTERALIRVASLSEALVFIPWRQGPYVPGDLVVSILSTEFGRGTGPVDVVDDITRPVQYVDRYSASWNDAVIAMQQVKRDLLYEARQYWPEARYLLPAYRHPLFL